MGSDTRSDQATRKYPDQATLVRRSAVLEACLRETIKVLERRELHLARDGIELDPQLLQLLRQSRLACPPARARLAESLPSSPQRSLAEALFVLEASLRPLPDLLASSVALREPDLPAALKRRIQSCLSLIEAALGPTVVEALDEAEEGRTAAPDRAALAAVPPATNE
ncbi:hypothetical protein SAMN06265365_14215 [Tistlia consotensis]|uniref:Uncharacterized protein n=2 Tax=Tistlia TaxID=1321364 RepID=A0A1Y6CQ32_9PROT|nr:hypothetical protein SAMN05428998_14515 [Tistlia consotensis USBA 355]SNS25167.1 hypothetical protein SAMN06265365_14215 [Tistlia consotensis]